MMGYTCQFRNIQIAFEVAETPGHTAALMYRTLEKTRRWTDRIKRWEVLYTSQCWRTSEMNETLHVLKMSILHVVGWPLHPTSTSSVAPPISAHRLPTLSPLQEKCGDIDGWMSPDFWTNKMVFLLTEKVVLSGASVLTMNTHAVLLPEILTRAPNTVRDRRTDELVSVCSRGSDKK